MELGRQVAMAFYEALKAGGANFVVHLPDSVLDKIVPPLAEDPNIQTLVCSREDEGIAMAAGAYLGGKLPVAIMEGSGIGYSGLILARCILQRTPMLLLVSHNRVLGEHLDFHGATRLTGEGVLQGLGIPYLVIHEASQVRCLVEEALWTVRGQKSIVGLFVPNYVMGGVRR